MPDPLKSGKGGRHSAADDEGHRQVNVEARVREVAHGKEARDSGQERRHKIWRATALPVQPIALPDHAGVWPRIEPV